MSRIGPTNHQPVHQPEGHPHSNSTSQTILKEAADTRTFIDKTLVGPERTYAERFTVGALPDAVHFSQAFMADIANPSGGPLSNKNITLIP